MKSMKIPFWLRLCTVRCDAFRVAHVALLTYCSAVVTIGCSSWHGSSSSLYRAEELTQQESYDEAIAAYREHIDDRLEVSDRPDWENPYFYLLRIGDIQLRQQQPGAALESYREAELQQVEASLISDRYRAVAAWYIEHGQLQDAFDLLKKHRDRDSLLFDAMLDRVSRELTTREERKDMPVERKRRLN